MEDELPRLSSTPEVTTARASTDEVGVDFINGGMVQKLGGTTGRGSDGRITRGDSMGLAGSSSVPRYE